MGRSLITRKQHSVTEIVLHLMEENRALFFALQRVATASHCDEAHEIAEEALRLISHPHPRKEKTIE